MRLTIRLGLAAAALALGVPAAQAQLKPETSTAVPRSGTVEQGGTQSNDPTSDASRRAQTGGGGAVSGPGHAGSHGTGTPVPPSSGAGVAGASGGAPAR